MKEVKCPKCNRKLGEIDGLTIIFESGVKPMKPTSSAGGLIVIPFKCNNCGAIHMQTVVLKD